MPFVVMWCCVETDMRIGSWYKKPDRRKDQQFDPFSDKFYSAFYVINFYNKRHYSA